MYSFIDKLCWYHLQFQSKKLIYKKVKVNLKIHSQIKKKKKKEVLKPKEIIQDQYSRFKLKTGVQQCIQAKYELLGIQKLLCYITREQSFSIQTIVKGKNKRETEAPQSEK